MKRPFIAAILAIITSCSRPNPSFPNSSYTAPNLAEIQANAKAVRAAMAKTAADCPWPPAGTFGHTAEIFDPGRRAAPLTPEIMKAFVPGCAIIAFSVDEDGLPTRASIVAANPPAVGPTALRIVQQRAYARGDTPDTAFLIRLGLDRRPNGAFSISEMSR